MCFKRNWWGRPVSFEEMKKKKTLQKVNKIHQRTPKWGILSLAHIECRGQINHRPRAHFDVLKYNSSSSSKIMIFFRWKLVATIIFKGTWLISCLAKEPGNRLTKLLVGLESIQRVDHAD